jgi:hypothetical protein
MSSILERKVDRKCTSNDSSTAEEHEALTAHLTSSFGVFLGKPGIYVFIVDALAGNIINPRLWRVYFQETI